MTMHLDIELAEASAVVSRVADFDLDISAEMPSVEFGVPGLQGPEGPPGGALISGYWDYQFATSPPVSAGFIRTAPAVVAVDQPMTIYLAARDDMGFYWNTGAMGPGSSIRLRGSGGAVQYATVTTFDITVPGPDGYATIGTILTSSTGQIAKNARVEVSLIQATGGEASSVASQILVTPVGDIQSTNVQAALQELDEEKPSYAYVKAHGVYIDPEPPPGDPTEWGLWVDSS